MNKYIYPALAVIIISLLCWCLVQRQVIKTLENDLAYCEATVAQCEKNNVSVNKTNDKNNEVEEKYKELQLEDIKDETEIKDDFYNATMRNLDGLLYEKSSYKY